MLKKTILATLIGSTLLASGASFAGPYDRHFHKEVVVQHVYRPAPRPVMVQRYYQPRPVVIERRVVVQHPVPVYSYGNDAGLAIFAGALIGGAIAYHIANN